MTISPSSQDTETLNEAELTQMMEAHRLWLMSEGSEGRRANFRGKDLRHLNLRSLNLVHASLRGANMQGMDLSHAYLEGADCAEADLRDAYLRSARASGANFTRANLSGVDMREAQMMETQMLGAICRKIDATGANFTQANLRDSDCQNAIFNAADLTQANLRGASCTEAVFNKTIMEEADIREVNFAASSISGANFAYAQCRGARFERVTFNDADFAKAIDLDPIYQSGAIEQERKQLNVEIQNLVHMRDEIKELEEGMRDDNTKMRKEREALEEVKQADEQLLSTFAEQGKLFRLIAGIWFMALAVAITFGVAFFAINAEALALSPLQWVYVAAGGLALFALHGTTTLLSYRTYKQLADAYQQRLDTLEGVSADKETIA